MVMVNLDVAHRPLLIIGGGQLAERRLLSLLNEGGQVTLVSPQITPQIEKWAREKRIIWLEKALGLGTDEDTLTCELRALLRSLRKGCDRRVKPVYPVPLLILATDQASLQERLARVGQTLGCLVERVDGLGDVTMANAVNWGGLLVALSTEPAAPRLNALIRADLEKRYGVLKESHCLHELSVLRNRLKDKVPDSAKRQAFWRRNLQAEDIEAILDGRWDCVKERLEHAISAIGLKS